MQWSFAAAWRCTAFSHVLAMAAVAASRRWLCYLPLAPEASSCAPTQPSHPLPQAALLDSTAPREVPLESCDFSKLSVLFADDNGINRIIAENFLKDCGLRAYKLARDGQVCPQTSGFSTAVQLYRGFE